MVDFTNGAKYGQRDANGHFIGIGHNSIFMIDPRLTGNKIAQDSRYTVDEFTRAYAPIFALTKWDALAAGGATFFLSAKTIRARWASARSLPLPRARRSLPAIAANFVCTTRLTRRPRRFSQAGVVRFQQGL